MTNNSATSLPAAPETPAQKPASRKTLYILLGGVGVFLCACLCLIAGVAGVYGISRIQFGSGHHAANATWQMDVTSLRSSTSEVSDSTGGTVSPKTGYTFIIVTAKIRNVSGKSQTFYLSAGNSDAGLKDENGNRLNLAAMRKGNSNVYINFTGQVQMLFIYSTQETYEFYFVTTEGNRGPFTFTFMDLPSVGPLSLP